MDFPQCQPSEVTIKNKYRIASISLAILCISSVPAFAGWTNAPTNISEKATYTSRGFVDDTWFSPTPSDVCEVTIVGSQCLLASSSTNGLLITTAQSSHQALFDRRYRPSEILGFTRAIQTSMVTVESNFIRAQATPGTVSSFIDIGWSRRANTATPGIATSFVDGGQYRQVSPAALKLVATFAQGENSDMTLFSRATSEAP